ncbi:MAG: TetR/AcrR family transcriptional regulator [Flavobacteriales bacterium]
MEPTEAEKRILQAATLVFERDGFLGARMQVIADEAGISKASLHYYFRTKEKLFDRIFDDYTASIVPLLSTWEDGTDEWQEKVRHFVKGLMRVFSESSLLFMAQELHRDPKKLEPRMAKRRTGPNAFIVYYERLRAKGLVRDTDPRPLLVAMQSICAYPSMNPKMLAGSLRMNNKEYTAFITSYADDAAELLVRMMEK